MKNFEYKLNDHKLNIELLFALIKAVIEHLDLDYEIKGDTGGYVIKVKKNGRKNNTI